MSSPIPDPGAVPDEPNFTDLPSSDEPEPGTAVPPPPGEDDGPDDAVADEVVGTA